LLLLNSSVVVHHRRRPSWVDCCKSIGMLAET
jgi:hypothetical protein